MTSHSSQIGQKRRYSRLNWTVHPKIIQLCPNVDDFLKKGTIKTSLVGWSHLLTWVKEKLSCYRSYSETWPWNTSVFRWLRLQSDSVVTCVLCTSELASVQPPGSTTSSCHPSSQRGTAGPPGGLHSGFCPSWSQVMMKRTECRVQFIHLSVDLVLCCSVIQTGLWV